MKRIIALNGLRAFESAARLLSFTAAAEELGVTPSAVSHQIAALEEALGVRLFQRLPRTLLLTEGGETLRPYISAAFDNISQGMALVTSDVTKPQTLKLQVYVTVAARWLMSRLASFRISYPNVQIQLDTTIMDWDFDPNRTDLGFIYAVNPRRDGVEYCQLFKARLVLVCNKALALNLKSGSALAQSTKIEVLQSPLDWEVWSQHNKFDGLQLANIQQFDSLMLAIEAAIQGIGVLVIPEFIVHDDLRAGRLVSPLGRPVPQLGCWYVAYTNARKFDKGIMGFKKWLGEKLASTV